MFNNSFLKAILLSGFILLNVVTKASVTPYPGQVLKTTTSPPVVVTTGSTSTAEVGTPPYTNASYVDKSVVGKITLSVDHSSSVFVPTTGTIIVNIQVQKTDQAGTLTTESKALELNYQPFPASGLQYNDKSVLTYDNYYKLKITVQSITLNGTTITNLPANLIIENEILVERYTNFASAATPMTLLTCVPINEDCVGGNDEVQIKWPTVTGAEEYQLEWAFVNDYGTSLATSIPAGSLPYDFRNNSTRITTTATSYRVSLTFDRGYLIWRVRGIGRNLTNTAKPVVGAWSRAATGNVGSLTDMTERYSTTAHESNKNWQYSATYAEEGKKKEVVSYFDGSLRNRQSVTKIESDTNVVVGETIYDHQGRPAVNVLPVPVKMPAACSASYVSPTLHYYENFNRVNLGTAYSRLDFDVDNTDTCTSKLTPMDASSGASFYYSPSNDNKKSQQSFVPDAELYPFSQTEYTPDNTGRIRRQGGVGKDFQLNGSHATRYYYGTPAQRQLDRLFGSEVGNAAHYKKNVVIDANGQSSITYLDQEGRTVATALAGNRPASLDSLPNASPDSTLTIDFINKDATGKSTSNTVSVQGDALEFGSQLLVAYASVYDFAYNLSVDKYNANCLLNTVCFNCVYDMEIKITDDCGNPVLVEPGSASPNPVVKRVGSFNKDGSGNFTSFTTACLGAPYVASEAIKVRLLPGNYTITKRLTVNKDAKDYYVAQYLKTTDTPTPGTYVNISPASCVKTYQAFLTDAYSKIDTSACNISCVTCVNALKGSYATIQEARDGFVAAGKGSELDFDYLIEECTSPCREISVCAANYEILLMDVSPDGQYGEFQPASDGTEADMNLSVFNPGNLLSKNTSGQGNWHTPKILVNGTNYGVYMDDHGTRSRIFVTLNNVACPVTGTDAYCTPDVVECTKVYYDNVTKSYYTYPENLKNLKDFVANWNDNWAKSLVSFHPEYPYYESCLSYNIKPTNFTTVLTSDGFDSVMVRCTTYTDAVNLGLIKASYAAGGAPANMMTMLRFLNTGAGNLQDPFIFGSAYSADTAILMPILRQFQDGKSIVVTAARAARCGNYYGVSSANLPSNCGSFGLNDDPDYLNREWNLLKNMYLSQKQMVQRLRDENYARNNYGYNGCIGNPNYTAASHGMLSNPFWGSPFFNIQQPCSFQRMQFYLKKKKRFNITNDQTAPTKEENDYQLYLQNGQGPMETSLQGFLNMLLTQKNPSNVMLLMSASAEPLQKYPEFSQDLYTALYGSTPLPPAYISYSWKYVSSNSTNLTGNILLGTGPTIKSAFSLNSTVAINWSSVVSISQLKYNSLAGPTAFKAVAAIANPAGSLRPYTYYDITGTTGFVLNGYNPTEETLSKCNTNTLAQELSNLWSSLLFTGQLNSTVNLNTGTYSPFLTSTIKNTLGATSNNLTWNYNSGLNRYELYETSSKKLIMQISSGSTAGGAVITDIKKKDATTINTFKATIKNFGYTPVSSIEGIVSLDVSGTVTPVSLGDCGLPTSVLCTGSEYQIGKDLLNLLKDVMVKKPFDANRDLTASPYYTPLLQSAIGTSDKASTSKYTFTTLNASNDFREELTYNLLCKCQITLWHNGVGSLPAKFSDLANLYKLVPYGPADNANNKFKFYIPAFYIYQGDIAWDDTIWGESCLPLKYCDNKQVADTAISPITPYVNPCATQLLNMAVLNAQVAYKQYTDSLTTEVAGGYTNHCINTVVEGLTGAYKDREYHYTLYYYDQAGNLVKTVPPEGVVFSTDFTAIANDRNNNTQNYYTQHRMATTYTYNSLNQLIRQAVPDQDSMNVWEYSLTNGLDSRLVVTASQFVSANKGYLTGYIDVAGIKRGYLYTSDDGGITWKRMNDMMASDFKKVQMVSATVGYAVGHNGVVMKTADGGNSWDIVPLTVTAFINDLYFNPAVPANGIVVAENTGAYKTFNGGTTWAATSSGLTVSSSVTSITYDGTFMYVSLVSGANSKLFKGTFSAGTFASASYTLTWSDVTNVNPVDIIKIQMVDATRGFAVSGDGNLLKTLDAGVTWAAVPTGLTGGFKDIYFKTATTINDGVAIIENVPGQGLIYKTNDGGITWKQLSDNDGSYYNSFQFYANDKGYAVGNNKIKRIVLLSNFGLVNVPLPATTATDLVTAYFSDGNSGWVANATTAWFTRNALDKIPVWTSIAATGFSFKEVYFDYSASPATGMALATDGSVYKITGTSPNFVFTKLSVTGDNYIDMDVSGTRVFFFNRTGTTDNVKSVIRTNIPAAVSLSTSGGATFAAAANVNTLDVYGSATFIFAGGANAVFSKGTISGTTVTWPTLAVKHAPLPIYHIEAAGTSTIYAVGAEGTYLQTLDAGVNWKTIPTATTAQFNSIRFNKSGTTAITAVNGLIVGNGGTLVKTAITLAGVVTNSAIPTNTTLNLDDAAVNSSNKAYAVGDGGTLLYIPTLVTPVVSTPTQKPTVDFAGVCFVPGTSNVIVVGNNSNIYTYNGTSGAKINTLYLRKLNDVSFFNTKNGYVIGENNYTIRYTTDGGLSWSFVSRAATSNMNAISAYGEGLALIVGDAGYIGKLTGSTLVSTTQGTQNLYDVKMEAAPKNSYIVGTNSAFKSINAGTTWNNVGTAPTVTLRSIHVFRNNTSFVTAGTAGTAGKVYCYTGTAWVNQSPPSLSTGLNSVFFHDDRNGYVVGDAGVIYRWFSSANMISFATTQPNWTAKSLIGNNGVATPSTININTISFATRFKGFIGGLSTGTPVNFARVINDESNLFTNRFWYDRLGRMVVSQNTKQYNRTDFSYTLYDALGRIIEVGEKTDNASGTLFYQIFGDYVNGKWNPYVINSTALNTWATTGTARREVTHTYYDKAITGSPLTSSQLNLTKRVASITYEDVDDANELFYQHATHYSYDIHGNVKTLWQENQSIPVTDQRTKRIDYEYDLISGKVNVLRYQDGQPDAFYHFYCYDSDNRIKAVYTSSYPQSGKLINYNVVYGNRLWSQDAKYFYYRHGPLARVEMGENLSQGIDYAYTLQGWIKGVNSSMLNESNDMGRDGNASSANKNVARDAFGYSLTYFQDDYKSIDQLKWNAATSRFEAFTAGSDVMAARNDLYNGNITAMATTITQPKLYTNNPNEKPTVLPQAAAYKYDQLNRIKDMQAYTNLNMTTGNANYNKWENGSTYANRYKNSFQYDANGNIVSQVRHNAAGTQIDNLTYKYPEVTLNGKKFNTRNRLQYVTDGVTNDALFTDDIDGQAAGNYGYDEIGNLKSDLKEEIGSIDWTVYGKIKKINRTGPSTKSDYEFKYDAAGNRIAKIEKPDNSLSTPNLWKTTYYVRDAQGNTLGTYEYTNNGTTSFKLLERPIYGSSRIGTENTQIQMVSALPTANPYKKTLGNKYFEGSNHLGNVLCIFTDKKIPRDDDMSGGVDYFQPEIISTSDYTAFGAPMTERNFSVSTDVGSVVYQSNYATIDGWANDWGPASNTTITAVTSQLRIVANVQFGGAEKVITTVPGKQYRYTLNIASLTGLAPNDLVYFARKGSGGNIAVQTTKVTGVYTLVFTAEETTTRICVELNTAGAAVQLSSAKLELLPDKNYRYAFNGKEKDDEIQGNGNTYDYGERIYNPRLGRFLSIDPLTKEYPELTTYQFASNDPIRNIDIDGLEGGSAIEYMFKSIANDVQSWWNSFTILPSSSSSPNKPAPPANKPKTETVIKKPDTHTTTTVDKKLPAPKPPQPPSKPQSYTAQDAKVALTKVYDQEGEATATTVERIYRLETNHFKSKQFKLTGTGGMESHAKTNPYGWYKPFFTANPQYTPLGTTGLFEGPGMSGKGGNAQVTDKQKQFVIMPSVEAGMMFLVDYSKRNANDGGFARWYSTDAAKQEIYLNSLLNIKPRFVLEIKKDKTQKK